MRIRTRQPDVTPALEGVPPLLSRIYRARGVHNAGELDRSLGRLLTPEGMPDVDPASRRLARSITSGEAVLVVGDFDADGATSVALAVSVLRAMGAKQVDYIVPNRFEYGYGLSPEIVDLARGFEPSVLVTVDNGVSSIAGVARANALGMDVIVTDHHLPGRELPAAFAIVNPCLKDSRFASRSIAGVGVIYYLLAAVRSRLRDAGWFVERPEPNLADWLDLVALGTVADVVPLDANNRVLVHQGVSRIRAGRCRPGIAALCEAASRDPRKITAADLGYALGPRLNAAGRLDDMSIGIRCLLAESLASARPLAAQLDELNRARRELQQEMVRDAELIVAEHAVDAGDRYGVCVYDAGWHQGVVGLVAGRLREKIHRPVIAFADAGAAAPDELKGSARSLPELHVRDALDAIATRHPGMLSKFGGHAMAAGLSIKRVHYERFAKIFDEQVRRSLPPTALQRAILTDGVLDDDELQLQVARMLAEAGPWGQGFPEPQFHDRFQLVSQRVVGERHLKLVLKRGERLFDAIAFEQMPLAPGSQWAEVVYRLAENDYRDLPTLQLVVEHLAALA